MLEMPGMIVYWKNIFITTSVSFCNWRRRELFQPPACLPFQYSYSVGSLVEIMVARFSENVGATAQS
jgi:hypothetical protein